MRPARELGSAALGALFALALTACADGGGGATDVGPDVLGGDVGVQVVPAPDVPADLWRMPDDVDCGLSAAHLGDLTVSAAAGSGRSCVLGDLVIEHHDRASVALEGVRVVTGDVRIRFNDGLERVSLPALEYVGGNLSIVDNASLAEVGSAWPLRTIAGELRVQQNPALTGLDAPDLRAVGGGVLVATSGLEEVTALADLVAVGGTVDVRNNAALARLEVLLHGPMLGQGLVVRDNPGLRYLGAGGGLIALPIGGLLIENNPALEVVEGFTLLERARTVELLALPALRELRAFEVLSKVDTLSVHRVAGLTDLDVFASLAEVGAIELVANPDLTEARLSEALESLNRLTITTHPALEEVTGPTGLETVLWLEVAHNDALTRIAGFDAITWTQQTFEIAYNDALEQIAGFDKLETVNSLVIRGNPSLRSLSGLARLTGAETLRVVDNDALEDLDGLRALVVVNGTFEIRDNAALANVDGLRALAVVGTLELHDNPSLAGAVAWPALSSADTLSVEDNPLLEALEGAPELALAGRIEVKDNDALTTIEGFDTLSRIDAQLAIERNAALSWIGFDALNALAEAGEGLRVLDNAALPTCLVDSLVARLRTAGWAGDARIRDNRDGCVCSDADPPAVSCP